MEKKIVQKLKEENQDYEFYPTTCKMITAFFNDYVKNRKDYKGCPKDFSLLDIGAGTGNIFHIIETQLLQPEKLPTFITKFAIEKSEILINAMPKDIIVIGTDFEKQTLIDKRVDVIFSNPPYKKYKEWVLKILQEANCNIAYLVIPARWLESEEIVSLLKKREVKYSVVYSDTFEDSEYRKSRAKIDILKIEFTKKEDSFDIWFNENFKINAEKDKYYVPSSSEKKERIAQGLVKGKNLVENLSQLYNQDMKNLLANYKKLENIDYELFSEMGVNFSNLKKALKEKIENLKTVYWEEFFNHFDKITERLTSKSRKKIRSVLTKHTYIDFSVKNAYAILIWVLKNANVYIDDQLKEVYFEMTSKKNMINYKSNKKLVEDGWRFQKFDQTHYKLDYRLVFKQYNCFNHSSYGSYDYPNNLYRATHTFLNDIITIGYNLGFNKINSSHNFNWIPGKEETFYYENGIFMRVRAYKNGNVHCKMNQEFMKKFNIEMARINHWIKNETECSKELDISIDEVTKFYGQNRKILLTNAQKLLE